MTDAFADDAAEIAELEKQQEAAGQGPGGKGAVQDQPAPETQQPAQEQAQPEAKDDDEEIEVENRGRFIRASVAKAAEERRKDAEKRAQEVEAKYAEHMARVQERLAMLVENRQTQEQKPEVQIPDINTDPLGHFQAKSAVLEKQLGEINEWRKGQEKTSEQQTAMTRVVEEVTRLEADFSRTTPDYADAMQHLKSTWAAEARVAGIPEQMAIAARAREIAQLAARANRNPAELGYELAKARGYAKKAPGTGNGQQQGPTLETLQRGIASSKSTSAAPGRAAPGTPTLDALVNMDDDEFIKNYVGRDNPKWRKVAGGLA
jgi:hypothetical protein